MGKGKRKKSKSPIPTSIVNAKKLKNGPSGLNSLSSQPIITPHVSRTAAVTQDKPVKPVFINANIQVTKRIISSLKFSLQPLCKVRSSSSTQVSCFSIADKKCLIDKLKSQLVGFHTFSEPCEKPFNFILKGFYHTTGDDLLKLLQDSDIHASKVTDFIRKDDYVMYLVQFSSQTNVNVLNHSHCIVDGIVIKWENLRKSNKKVTQCFNCQQWGHSSVNCGLQARCVKCAESHPKGECPRISREGTPKCCNCGGDHSANHRGCPTYKKFTESRVSRAPKMSSVHLSSSSSPVDYSSQFPPLSGSRVGHSKLNNSSASLVQHHSAKMSSLVSPKTNQELSLDTTSFPPLIPSQDVNQPSTSSQNCINKPIDYAEKLNEAIANENLLNRLVTAQEKLKQKPKLIELINKICTLYEKMEKAATLGEAASLFVHFRSSFNEKDSTS